MKEVDLFIIHGIAKEINPLKYYNKFVDSIRKYLPIDFSLRIHPIDHSHLLKEKEEDIATWFTEDRYVTIRKWACDYICDVIALAPSEHPSKGNFYYDVLDMLANKYDEVDRLQPKSKKIIIDHSLGAQIAVIFSHRRELNHLITMGGPMNYFFVRFPNFGKYPEALLKNWTNFHYRRDVISGRVRENPRFARSEVTDVVLRNWNPLNWPPTRAHRKYWRDKNVHKKIASILLTSHI